MSSPSIAAIGAGLGGIAAVIALKQAGYRNVVVFESAIQFVPAIQPQVGQLEVFQRSAPYLLPRPDREFSAVQHKLFQRVPATLLAERGIWYGVVEGLSVAWVYSKTARRSRAQGRVPSHAASGCRPARPVREGVAGLPGGV